jgi:hypothetical protein
VENKLTVLDGLARACPGRPSFVAGGALLEALIEHTRFLFARVAGVRVKTARPVVMSARRFTLSLGLGGALLCLGLVTPRLRGPFLGFRLGAACPRGLLVGRCSGAVGVNGFAACMLSDLCGPLAAARQLPLLCRASSDAGRGKQNDSADHYCDDRCGAHISSLEVLLLYPWCIPSGQRGKPRARRSALTALSSPPKTSRAPVQYTREAVNGGR